MIKLTMNTKYQLVVKSFILILILSVFSILPSWGQSGKLFNTDNQLSSNLATQVFQDKSGFIWIATRNGLNAYDGYHISIMKKDLPNSPGLKQLHQLYHPGRQGTYYIRNQQLFAGFYGKWIPKNPYVRLERQRTHHIRNPGL